VAKRKQKHAERGVAVASPSTFHDFDVSGLLGHDSTYVINVSERVALAVSTFYACVRTIADLVSDGDVQEIRGNEILPPSRIVLRPMVGRRPNIVTRRTWLWLAAACSAVYNGFYLHERGGRDSEGVPMSLVPIAPPRITFDSEEWRLDGNVINREDLLYVPRASWPMTDTDAGSTVKLARDAIAAAWAQQAYSADFWQAGGAPVIYIKTDQALSKAQAGEIRDDYATARADNPGKPAVIGRGGDIKTLGADLSGAAGGEAGDRTDRAIAQYLGVPAWLVNVSHAAGSMVYQNAAAAGLDLVRYNLRPGYSGPIADAWSEFLPGGYLTGRRVHIGLDHLTEGTVLEQFQAFQIATGGKSWMLPSEVRNKLHMPIDMTLDEQGTPAPAIESIPAEDTANV
jgi:hypothetical protein